MTALDIAPAELARSITGRDYFSWSQAQSYLMCPRAFCFRYVESVEPEFTPSSLVFGGALHDCFAEHHRAQLEGTDVPSLEEQAERVDSALSSADPAVRFGSSETHDGMLELTERMLEAFIASDFASPDGQVVGIEEHVRGVISNEIPPVEGYVDLVTLHDGQLTITDYKSTRTKWTESKVRESAGQLLLYSMLQSDGSDDGLRDSSCRLQFVTLSKAKKPVIAAHPVTPSDSQREATVTQLEEIWRGISAGSFPARPGWQCGTCPLGGGVSTQDEARVWSIIIGVDGNLNVARRVGIEGLAEIRSQDHDPLVAFETSQKVVDLNVREALAAIPGVSAL